jgi:hypothetical protein
MSIHEMSKSGTPQTQAMISNTTHPRAALPNVFWFVHCPVNQPKRFENVSILPSSFLSLGTFAVR